jgi:hypothetical protein
MQGTRRLILTYAMERAGKSTEVQNNQLMKNEATEGSSIITNGYETQLLILTGCGLRVEFVCGQLLL